MKRRPPQLDGLDDPFPAEVRSHARPVDDPRARREPDPEAELRVRLRRRAARLLFYAVFIAGAIAALVGERGLFDLVRLRGERARAHEALEQQRAAVEAQRLAVERLKTDPMARERIAREQLGLARPGEIVFLLPEHTDLTPGPGVEEGNAGEEGRGGDSAPPPRP